MGPASPEIMEIKRSSIGGLPLTSLPERKSTISLEGISLNRPPHSFSTFIGKPVFFCN